MFNLLRSVWALLLSLLLIIFGNTYFMSFLAVRMELNETNSQILGIISFAYYLGFALGAFLIEKVIKRIV